MAATVAVTRYEARDIRQQYTHCCEDESNPRLFGATLWNKLGLCDDRGRPYRDAAGFPTLAEKRIPVEAFPLRALTEGVLGPQWAETLGLNGGGSSWPVQRWLQEEATAPIGPGAFINVSVWSNAVAGLALAKMLEGYNDVADFELADLFPKQPAAIWDGERLIDVIGPLEPAKEIGPGESHPDLRMDEAWVQAGPLKKYGFKILVTRESAWADITGGRVLQRAKEGGRTIRYRENELNLDVITGVTNNFAFGKTKDSAATTYNTFGPSIGAGGTVSNDAVVPLTDWTSFQTVDTAVANYGHPIFGTGVPMLVDFKILLVPTPLANQANIVLSAQSITQANQPGSPAPQIATSTFPTGSVQADNPYRNRYTIVPSIWLHKRHVAMGLTGAALNRAYLIDPNRFARQRIGWEADVADVAPSEFIMRDQGIVAGQVGNIATMTQVISPWGIYRMKGA